jgi:hypothetical protein
MVQGTPAPKRRELIRDKARRKGLTKSRKVLSNGRKGRTNGRKAPANGRKGLTCNRKAPSNGRKDPSSGGISRFLLPYRCLKPKSVLRWGVGCGPHVPSSHSSRRGSGFTSHRRLPTGHSVFSVWRLRRRPRVLRRKPGVYLYRNAERMYLPKSYQLPPR